LVFVSDSVAVTKNTSNEMLTWVAHRTTGVAIANSDVAWSDGVGVLKTGKTGNDGVASLKTNSPETSYVYGVDPQGGVFITTVKFTTPKYTPLPTARSIDLVIWFR
jgi:uncharacterized protein YfaS (alpha-2-macroglobulin family)